MTTTDHRPTDHTDTVDRRQYPEGQYPNALLTQSVIGCMFRVYNELKFGHPERYYQRALAEELVREGIHAQRELHWPIRYGRRVVGRHFFDFLVEDALVVELKLAPELYANHLQQVLAYLRGSKHHLALIFLIRKYDVSVKRIIV
ncbi:MAG: GxxExxY protein [bacterium]|nr:GxxExxY protein [bacterium]